MPTNEYEERARQRKIVSLTSHFRARHITADELSTMHPDVLAHHVGLAGVKSPSPETWAGVSRLLLHLEEMERKHPDPFEGLS